MPEFQGEPDEISIEKCKVAAKQVWKATKARSLSPEPLRKLCLCFAKEHTVTVHPNISKVASVHCAVKTHESIFSLTAWNDVLVQTDLQFCIYIYHFR